MKYITLKFNIKTKDINLKGKRIRSIGIVNESNEKDLV